jgi:hypothetical protein
MDEMYLEDLTKARHRHVLACLHGLGGSELEALAGLDRVRAASAGLGDLVRFTGPATGPARPAAWLACPGESREDRDARIGGGAQSVIAATGGRR